MDTNVLVSVVRSSNCAARKVLRQCLAGDAQPLVGNTLFLEYEDVLSREVLFAKALIGPEERTALMDAVLGVCQWINISHLWPPNLPDESDNHLVELAVAGNAAWIVTGNARDVAEGELVFDGFQVVTPGAWLKGDN